MDSANAEHFENLTCSRPQTTGPLTWQINPQGGRLLIGLLPRPLWECVFCDFSYFTVSRTTVAESVNRNFSQYVQPLKYTERVIQPGGATLLTGILTGPWPLLAFIPSGVELQAFLGNYLSRLNSKVSPVSSLLLGKF